jgi:uncharacterized membrane protein
LPNLAAYHPVIVHFAIGFLVAGVLLRWVSLTGRVRFASPAAASLIILGTLAAVLSVTSGTSAHGPVERVPGSAPAVMAHETWGERARNAFILVSLVEGAILVLVRRGRERKAVLASAMLSVPALFCLYEAGEHGGELVYSYAGGVGIRTGDPQDVRRLLLAAAYHQAQLDRKEGRPQAAASVIEEAAARFPNDAAVQMLVAESRLLDAKDPAAALAMLGSLAVPPDDARLRVRQGMLLADAHEAAGRPEAARATLQQLLAAFPKNSRIRQRLEGAPAPAPR